MARTGEAVFRVRCDTFFGDHVRVVGSSDALGRWDPSLGLGLDTSPQRYPEWQSSPTILPEAGVEYKYIIVRAGGGEVVWEDGPNRSLELGVRAGSSAAPDRVTVRGAFGDSSTCIERQPTECIERQPMDCIERRGSSGEKQPSGDGSSGSCGETPRSQDEERQSPSAPAAPKLTLSPEAVGRLQTPELAPAVPASPQPTHRRAASNVDRLLSPTNSQAECAGQVPRSYSLVFGDEESSIDSLLSQCVGEALSGRDPALLCELPAAKPRAGLALSSGSYYRPKDGAEDGEDSFFVGPSALGVADGVGGLKQALGYTSKAFADELMASCQKSALRLVDGSDAAGRAPSEVAQGILREGWEEVRSNGASTAVVAYMDTSCNKLGIALVGDSGVMVVRRPTARQEGAEGDGRLRSLRPFVAFKSPAQQHGFNFPYQFCKLPHELAKLLLRPPDSPEDAATYDVQLEEGDLVLIYSDGLEDNLHDAEVLELCSRAVSPYAAKVLGLPDEAATPAKLLSEALGGAAYLRSLDPAAKTPFAAGARKAGMPVTWCSGGKEDDITCLAAWATHRGDQCEGGKEDDITCLAAWVTHRGDQCEGGHLPAALQGS